MWACWDTEGLWHCPSSNLIGSLGTQPCLGQSFSHVGVWKKANTLRTCGNLIPTLYHCDVGVCVSCVSVRVSCVCVCVCVSCVSVRVSRVCVCVCVVCVCTCVSCMCVSRVCLYTVMYCVCLYTVMYCVCLYTVMYCVCLYTVMYCVCLYTVMYCVC
jgi:hypothetical protein